MKNLDLFINVFLVYSIISRKVFNKEYWIISDWKVINIGLDLIKV